MGTVTVYDIISRSRTVKVPRKCPECGANLAKGDAIKVWEFQDQSRYGRLENSGMNWGTGTPNSADDYMECAYLCAACDLTLASGKKRTANSNDTSRGFDVLLNAIEREGRAMDPTQCLEEVREFIKELASKDAQADLKYAGSLGHGLAEKIEALDQWLMKGGFLPEQWGQAQESLPPKG